MIQNKTHHRRRHHRHNTHKHHSASGASMVFINILTFSIMPQRRNFWINISNDVLLRQPGSIFQVCVQLVEWKCQPCRRNCRTIIDLIHTLRFALNRLLMKKIKDGKSFDLTPATLHKSSVNVKIGISYCFNHLAKTSSFSLSITNDSRSSSNFLLH